MRKVEVSESVRRLVRVLLRWRRASVSAVSQATGVDQGNLSRLLGTTGTPGMGAARVAKVLAELGWISDGPTPRSVGRWTIDDEEDVIWMFDKMLKRRGGLAVVVHGEETLDKLEHVGILLMHLGTAVVVLDAAEGREDLIDLLLARSELAIRHPAIAIENEFDWHRLLRGAFHIDELGAMMNAPRGRLEIPEELAIEFWRLFGLLEYCDVSIGDLRHDLEVLAARSFRKARTAHLYDLLRAERFPDAPDGALLPGPDESGLRASSAYIADKEARSSYRLPWGRTPGSSDES